MAERKILSIFIPPIGKVEEMLYLFENPYEMNFDKFKKQFPSFKLTPYREELNKMVKSYKQN